MRLRRRFSESLSLWLIPLICCVITLYFGYSGIFGDRGLIAWNDARMSLAVERQELAQLRSQREALQHRIALMDSKKLDPDLLEEVARGVLAQGPADEVAVAREKTNTLH